MWTSPFFASRRRVALVLTPFGFAAVVAAGLMLGHRAQARQAAGSPQGGPPLVTGKAITPQGTQTQAGSIPVNMVLDPSGKYVLVLSMGDRADVTVLDVKNGKALSHQRFSAREEEQPNPNVTGRPKNEGLYYGLAFGPKAADGTIPVYAARGADSVVSVLSLTADGTLTDTERTIPVNGQMIAGLATSPSGDRLYATDNTSAPQHDMVGYLHIIDTAKAAEAGPPIPTPGYPYAIAMMTRGADAGKRIYVASEQRGTVAVIDTDAKRMTAQIPTGDHPLALLLDQAQDRLFVANAGSDTVSLVNTATSKVEKTILLRPSDAHGLPQATPTALALSPDEKTLYVTLGDLNAVAVIDLAHSGAIDGYIPVGWYPTAVVVSPDGARLFVANAKGVVVRTPNDKPVPIAGRENRPTYILNILEGTASTIDVAAARANLPALTRQTLANNRLVPHLLQTAREALHNPGVQHVVYIIKENRTYDQVLGDVSEGNGDPALVMFGQKITPNLHALADRFVLLDNFYCCAEVSADGWNWSTGGMANPYVIRNVPYTYTEHNHPYDFEGTNNGYAPDLRGIPDVARPFGGYLWDDALGQHISFRNYGMFTGEPLERHDQAETENVAEENAPFKKALLGSTDGSYRQFDLNYADSDAWVQMHIPPHRRQLEAFGKYHSPSRYTEWKREFDSDIAQGTLPQLTLMRLGNDHTSGTTPGGATPQALVADNDYAVGEIVDAISHSPVWKSTAIFILEDDAQSGIDHVDAHRSTAYVISPFVPKNQHDSRFYNTDSMLHTMENLLGLGPMNGCDAVAPTMNIFSAQPANDAPFTAIPPDKAIVSGVNARSAYRGQDSQRYFNPTLADAGPDDQMSDIVWHAVKGRDTPYPTIPHSAIAGTKPAARRGKDDD